MKVLKIKFFSNFDEVKANIDSNDSCKYMMALSSNLNDKNRTASLQIANELNRIIDEKNIVNSSRASTTNMSKIKNNKFQLK